jgi:hypothetical protein
MLSGQIKVVADQKDKKKHHRHKDKKHKKEVSITQHSYTIENYSISCHKLTCILLIYLQKKSSKIEQHHHSSNNNTCDDSDDNNSEHCDRHPAPPPPLQREDWMSAAMARPIDAPPQHKEDGANDNYQQQEGKAQPTSKVVDLAKDTNNNDTGNKTTKSTVGVGDGGSSWRLKALQRAKQRAQEGGNRADGSDGGGGGGFGQAVQERWGSLANLLEQQQLRPAHNLAHLHAARDRRRIEGNNGDRNDDKNRSMYLGDVKSARGQMRRPREDFGNGAAHNSRNRDGSSVNNKNKSEVLSWRKKNDDLTKEAAAEMNMFQNDGSFMQQYNTEENGKGKGEKRNEGKFDSGKVEMEKLAAATAVKLEQPPPLQQQQQGGGGDQNKSAAAMLRARLLGKVPPPPAATATLLPIPPSFSNHYPSSNATNQHPLPTPSSRNPKHNAYEGGERKRYFADDDTTNLHTLMKKTKYETSAAARGQAAGDMDVAIARGIMKNHRYATAEFDADAEYDHDAGIAHLDDSSGNGCRVGKGARRQMNRETVESMAKRQETQQWQQHKKKASALDRCQLCFASASRPRHLTLAIGQHTYLALPSRGRLVPGHVVIVPIEHVASIRKADEVVVTEVRNFKKCLIQMHAAAGGKECVFFETATRVEDDKSHAVIECVPLPPAAAARAPLVFKKTVDDASDEWSDHHSKRLINISRSKTGLQGSIPPNFPYMCVEFGLTEGFVHVIDNERGFNRNLARSVLVGLLGLSEEKGGQQRVRGESEAAQGQWAAEFRKQFDPYDWTQMLS